MATSPWRAGSPFPRAGPPGREAEQRQHGRDRTVGETSTAGIGVHQPVSRVLERRDILIYALSSAAHGASKAASLGGHAVDARSASRHSEE